MKNVFLTFLTLVLISPSIAFAATGKGSVATKQARTTARGTTPIGKNYNCSDFKSQAEAQSVFIKNGGKANDIFGLDRDKDGIACEALK
jgi:hypothetical protein